MGEGSDFDFGGLSASSLVGFVYLVLIGSVVGFLKDIRPSALIGAAVIVASVAFVVTRESTDVAAGEGNVAPPRAGERASG